MPWFDIMLSYPLIQTIGSKKSAQFFLMIDILGNSSEGLGYFQNSTFSHLYQRLLFYVPNWQCDQRDSFDFSRYVSLLHKLVEHEFVQFHSFEDQHSHNLRLDTVLWWDLRSCSLGQHPVNLTANPPWQYKQFQYHLTWSFE